MQTIDQRIEELELENHRLKTELLQKSLSDSPKGSWAQKIIDSLPNPLFIKNNKHEYISINQAFAELLRDEKANIIGKSDYDYFSKEQSDIFWRIDSEVLANGEVNWNEEEMTVEGNMHKLLTSKTRLIDRNGNHFILGLITDITENKNQQILLLKKNKEIEEQRKNVETLLQEIHHRVKNNMQIVSSLLSMQMYQFEDEKVQEAFINCKNRIIAMANVHEILYQSNNFAHINFEHYLDKLLENIKGSYHVGDEVNFNVDVLSLFLNIEKAIPLGLIITEIITNAIKHGLIDEETPLNITIKMQCEGENCTLNVGDDGKGMKGKTPGKGMGLELIELLSDQLNATCEQVESEKGVAYQLNYSAK
jgi:PAS domain S-box-containing protein